MPPQTQRGRRRIARGLLHKRVRQVLCRRRRAGDSGGGAAVELCEEVQLEQLGLFRQLCADRKNPSPPSRSDILGLTCFFPLKCLSLFFPPLWQQTFLRLFGVMYSSERWLGFCLTYLFISKKMNTLLLRLLMSTSFKLLVCECFMPSDCLFYFLPWMQYQRRRRCVMCDAFSNDQG